MRSCHCRGGGVQAAGLDAAQGGDAPLQARAGREHLFDRRQAQAGQRQQHGRWPATAQSPQGRCAPAAASCGTAPAAVCASRTARLLFLSSRSMASSSSHQAVYQRHLPRRHGLTPPAAAEASTPSSTSPACAVQQVGEGQAVGDGLFAFEDGAEGDRRSPPFSLPPSRRELVERAQLASRGRCRRAVTARPATAAACRMNGRGQIRSRPITGLGASGRLHSDSSGLKVRVAARRRPRLEITVG